MPSAITIKQVPGKPGQVYYPLEKITIPDLRPLFQHWPTKLSEHVDPMREDIQQWINE